MSETEWSPSLSVPMNDLAARVLTASRVAHCRPVNLDAGALVAPFLFVSRARQ